MNYYKQYVVDIKQTLDGLPWESIQEIVYLLHQARLSGKQVFVMGNGGSASTASHMACDLNKNTVAPNHPRFRVMALTDSMALFSACANDFSYEDVFAEQLENFVREGDVVVAISASGNSPNVLKAVKLARAHKAITIGWSGYDGGKLAGLVDFPVVVPSQSIEQIEDIHLMLEHMITVALRNKATEPVALNGDYIFGLQRVEAY
ncbi:MAG: SIS domain-containing protein [Chloroflexi bacterium]|nr:SIS domain-containing protein [Chloroflexota bacterium]